MENQTLLLYQYLQRLGFSLSTSEQLNAIFLTLSLSVIIIALDLLTRNILLKIITRITDQSKTNFDDIMVKNKVPFSHYTYCNYIQCYPLFICSLPEY